MAWTRSNFANFPKVHCKFWAKDTNGVDLVEYRIQDVEDDGHEDVILHMIKYFLPDEPTFSSRGAANDVVLQNEISSVWRRVLKQRVSLVCYKGNSTEIIAVNILHVSTTERSKLEPESETLQVGLSLMHYVSEQVQHFKKHNVDKYLSGFGLSVNPNYRKRGVATEMLKARKYLLPEIDLILTCTGFTAVGSQKAAMAAGYALDFEISYADLLEVDPKYNYPNIKSPSYKQLSLKI